MENNPLFFIIKERRDSMSPFLLITVLAILACCKVILQGRFSRSGLKTLFDSAAYNAISFLLIAVFLWLFFSPQGFEYSTFLWGAGVGALMVVYQVSYTYGLKNGPVSLTVLICNFNVLLTSIFCIFVFDEPIYFSSILGTGLLFLSMVFSLKAENFSSKMGLKWFCSVLLSLFASAGYTCLQKLYPHHHPDSDSTAFLIAVYICAFLGAGFVCLLTKPTHAATNNKAALLFYGAATAAVLTVYQKLFMYTLARTDGAFFSPTYAGMQSVLMSIIGVLLFRDRLSKKQWLGILFGILSIIAMNLQWGVFL